MKNRKYVLPDYKYTPELSSESPFRISDEFTEEINSEILKGKEAEETISLGSRFSRNMKYYLDDEEKHYKRKIENYKAREQEFESEKEAMRTAIGTGDINAVKLLCNKMWGSHFKI